MSGSPSGRRCVAGFNQFAKLVRRGKAKKVFLAHDADPAFRSAVLAELKAHKAVEVDCSRSSAELAAMAGVEVPTAVVTCAE
ncbi:MAG: ribosomal L7Ae/L30e/S12e/Gadd45 family protein [Clostridia bacterium]|nr:ribosomal L7Ae/L30e/S12e/Gadd45 family protein [Clostridia bacterium]